MPEVAGDVGDPEAAEAEIATEDRAKLADALVAMGARPWSPADTAP